MQYRYTDSWYKHQYVFIVAVRLKVSNAVDHQFSINLQT